MPTKYDDVWEVFQSIARVNSSDLPVSQEGTYSLINASRLEFNKRLQTDITQNDELEEFSEELTDKQIDLFANCIALVVYRNMLSQFISDMQVFQSSMGVRDYRSQVQSRQELVNQQNKIVTDTVFNITEEFEE